MKQWFLLFGPVVLLLLLFRSTKEMRKKQVSLVCILNLCIACFGLAIFVVGAYLAECRTRNEKRTLYDDRFCTGGSAGVVSTVFSSAIESNILLGATSTNLDASVNYLSQALVLLKKKTIVTLNARASALLQKGDYTGAYSDFVSVTNSFAGFNDKILPKCGRLCCELYLCLLANSDGDAASEWWNETLELERNTPRDNGNDARKFMDAFSEGTSTNIGKYGLSKEDQADIFRLWNIRNKIVNVP